MQIYKVFMRGWMSPVLRLSLALVLLSACVACKHDTAKLLGQNHPLVDRIWDTQQKTFISRDDMFARAQHSTYLLLGETHDNIRHHLHQAALITELHARQRRLSVHFEMLDDVQGQHLSQANYTTLDGLMAYLKASKAGWDYEGMYRPVFEQVMQSGAAPLPANLDKAQIRRIFAEGEQAIPPAVNALLQSVLFSTEQIRSLEQEIIEGHCNVMPDHMLSPMVLTQRVRDARLAMSLLQGDGETRILITGAGHARKDRGVPLYVQSQDSQGVLTSLAFIEVEEQKFRVADYTDRWDSDELPFDYVWFTPRYERADPCQGLEQRLNASPERRDGGE